MAEQTGVVVEQRDGRRSTSTLGREVVAAALDVVDPVGAAAARREATWRTGYHPHFRRLSEAATVDDLRAADVARAGLDALHARMRWHAPDAALVDAMTPRTPLRTGRVDGTGERATELVLPYRGDRLRGDALRRRLDRWVADGVIEPGAADAVRVVLDHPQWLDARDLRVAVLGAGAEMGPLRSLLRWGATVLAVDLPRPDTWTRLAAIARDSAGTLAYPCAADPAGRGGTGAPADADLVPDRAGADLLHDPGAVAQWLLAASDPASDPASGDAGAAAPRAALGASGSAGPLVLGNYVYADGATNLRLATACDVLTEHVRAQRPDTALAWLATPTDVFVVPHDAVVESAARYGAPGLGGLVRRPVSALTRGRLLARQYAVPVADGPGISDSVVPQQGPNYLLAKRVHRWRATVARAEGAVVSMNVAPPTRTRSVTKNRALAAAYAGAHRFGIEVFDPSTSNTLMAALLVHDLRTGGAVAGAPGPAGGAGVAGTAPGWRAEAGQACHGGLWRTGYDPRSALGIAAVLGMASARP